MNKIETQAALMAYAVVLTFLAAGLGIWAAESRPDNHVGDMALPISKPQVIVQGPTHLFAVVGVFELKDTNPFAAPVSPHMFERRECMAVINYVANITDEGIKFECWSGLARLQAGTEYWHHTERWLDNG